MQQVAFRRAARCQALLRCPTVAFGLTKPTKLGLRAICCMHCVFRLCSDIAFAIRHRQVCLFLTGISLSAGVMPLGKAIFHSHCIFIMQGSDGLYVQAIQLPQELLWQLQLCL